MAAAGLGPMTAAGDDFEAKLRAAFAAGELAGLHAVIVADREETLLEAYFPGEDERWGSGLGLRNHGPDTLHDLRSVTKSIVGLLYGIALSEGAVPALEESLLAQFPAYADLARDPARRTMTVGHALSMRMGTEWSEELPYSDPRNSEIAMEQAADRYRFALDRPMVSAPGEAWTYNGGAVALVGKLISDGTGMPIEDFARERLFTPLGITEFEWVRGGDGVASAASGLRLAPRDLAKIGRMIAGGGRYDGVEIVAENWLRASFVPRAAVEGPLCYGYLWWLGPHGDPPTWVAGFGNGGQRLTVAPESGLVVVVFAGNYNRPDAWTLPVKIVEEYAIPVYDQRVRGKNQAPPD